MTRFVGMGLFGRRSASPAPTASIALPGPGGVNPGRAIGFEYLSDQDVYLDSACQTMRPAPVINAVTEYYTNYNACGERVKYAWGKRVDQTVDATRQTVLASLGLSEKSYTTSFTLNTTYGLNLLQQQLPYGRFSKVVTTHTEHNSVFLSTMSAAARLNVPRVLLERSPDGFISYSPADLAGAVVVVSAMDNVLGAPTQNLAQLVADTRASGGITIIDAAQAAPHALGWLAGLPADAFCLSGHKIYGPSLGVVVTRNDLLDALEISFLGGGQVTSVSADSFELLPQSHAKLEPGLQAWGEIAGLKAALEWLQSFEATNGESLAAREARLSALLYDGLIQMPKLRVLSARGSSLISVLPERVDGHQLATFLGKANIMVRSGYFCAHHWLIDLQGLRPLVRFSIGAHNTESDIAKTLEITGRLVKGL